MNLAFKNKMNLTQAKQVLKEFKTGQIRRVDNTCASLKDSRGRGCTLIFKSNLELKGLVK
jgi:hypothetical protein